MKKSNKEIWDRLFKNESEKVQERQFEGLQHGSIDWDSKTGKAYLKYYSSHTSPTESKLDIDEIQTGQSPNDQLIKSTIALSQIVAAIMAGLSLHFDELLEVVGLTPQHDAIIIAFSLFGFVLGVAIWYVLDNHFLNTDRKWATAIQRIISVNIKGVLGAVKNGQFKIGAVAECMLAFRRFIKWRRYLTFLHAVLLMFWAGEIAALLFSIYSGVSASIVELAFLCGLVTWQAVVFSRVSYLRWFYTNWRDPTVQLCLAFVELDRQLVVAMRPGGPGAHRGSGSPDYKGFHGAAVSRGGAIN